MPIDMPVYIGARLARWHRSYSSLTLAELLVTLRRRFTGPLFLWYRSALELAFQVRNVIKRRAPNPCPSGRGSRSVWYGRCHCFPYLVEGCGSNARRTGIHFARASARNDIFRCRRKYWIV